MDLSIFDAFDKPASSSNSSNSSNSSHKRISLDSSDASHSQDKKKLRNEVTASSSNIKEPSVDIKEVTLTIPITTVPGSYIPAKEYKFKLDTFQQTAVDHIERGDSVLVAAHTSAGMSERASRMIHTEFLSFVNFLIISESYFLMMPPLTC